MRRCAVIIDEAHSSQGGETATDLKEVLGGQGLREEAARAMSANDEDDMDELYRSMAKRGRQANLSFFAFTATPKHKTLKVFGRDGKPAHRYTMRQAIEEGFILDVLKTKTLVGALGWDLFREMRGRAAEPLEQLTTTADDPSPVFLFRGEGFSAEMMISQSGDFVVKAGSKARARTTPTIPKGTLALRETLLKSGVLRVDASMLVFASDYSFTSAFRDAEFVTRVSGKCVLCGQLDRNLMGEALIKPPRHVDAGQLVQLRLGSFLQFPRLARDVGVFRISLRTDRDVFAGRHRHRSGDEAGKSGDQDFGTTRSGRGDPDNQARS
ncbi:hypothetical protein GCM10007315_35540 [Gemmobacter tilapiae]|uniref:SWI2/SNF2 ATPase domain-containing protein n=1 Tax=Neogemmobacter tilapiae TaxID=875041 RepID=A0A918WRE3_9RHOB|nr:hypothetical protein GCM10007315_35540 [Gemmobacter tilapiae]